MCQLKLDTDWFFVDESGDTTLYNRRGELVLDEGTCTPVFILGFIETREPERIRKTLAKLREAVRKDE